VAGPHPDAIAPLLIVNAKMLNAARII